MVQRAILKNDLLIPFPRVKNHKPNLSHPFTLQIWDLNKQPSEPSKKNIYFAID
jgi:hypothetical protein